MNIRNVSEALELISGDNPDEAWEWLRRDYCRRARQMMCYTDKKTGQQHSIPPLPTVQDAQDIAGDRLEQLRRCLPRFRTIPERYANAIWWNLRIDWYREASRRQPEGLESQWESESPHTEQRSEQSEGPEQSSLKRLAKRLVLIRTEEDRRALRLAFEAERAKAEGWLRRGLDAIYRFPK